MEEDLFRLNGKIYSNNNNVLLGIINDLQEIINNNKDNLIIKRLRDIIIKLNNIIKENKKYIELIRKDISELYNKLNQRFDELKYNMNQNQMIQNQNLMMCQQQNVMNQMMQNQFMYNPMMQNNFNLFNQNQMMMQQQNDLSSTISVFFKSGNDKLSPGFLIPPLQCSLNDKVSDLIEKYRNKSGDNGEDKLFIIEKYLIEENITLKEAGISNNITIFVEMKNINIIFRKASKHVLIQGKLDEKVSKIIERYRLKSSDNYQKLIFIFNAKRLDVKLTLAEAGLQEGANIFVNEY